MSLGGGSKIIKKDLPLRMVTLKDKVQSLEEHRLSSHHLN